MTSIAHSWGEGVEEEGVRGGGEHTLVPELNEDLLSPYIPSKLGVTQNNNAHVQVAKGTLKELWLGKLKNHG